MKAKKFKKLVAVIGSYTDSAGKEKKQYQNCGTLFAREDGGFTVKLDALPLGDFNGWIACYDFDDQRKEHNEAGMQQARAAAQPAKQQADHGTFEADFPDDDIPF